MGEAKRRDGAWGMGQTGYWLLVISYWLLVIGEGLLMPCAGLLPDALFAQCPAQAFFPMPDSFFPMPSPLTDIRNHCQALEERTQIPSSKTTQTSWH
jgi:hypothetical protein